MSKKFSLSYLTVSGTDPVEHIRIAKEAGYDFVSLRTIPMHLPGEPEFVMEKDPQLFAATKKALEEYGVSILEIEVARIHKDVDFREFRPAFEKAAQLGATDVLGSVWTRDKAWYTDAVGKVAEMAKEFGLCYNVEFLPWAGVRNLQEDITLIDKVNADNLFAVVDTLHAGRVGVTGEELARTPRKYFRLVHLCDGPAGPDGDPVLPDIRDELVLFTTREARLCPGDGDIDVAGMLKGLPELTYSIEIPNMKEFAEKGFAGHAANCLKKAKAFFAANGIE
ncbi:MAG: sugar phosphate isomerase/epimerase [Lachnospiraceae bacterium]|nr:sugar phosphate isomerase/epimerase [Lachnospiraceae bacterium]